MLQPCQDNYSTTFASYDGMRRYHEKESLESRWHRCRVNELHIEPLDKASPLYGTPSAFAAGIRDVYKRQSLCRAPYFQCH